MAVRKVTFNLPQEMVEFLQKQAEENHITVTDVLRRSINSERFFVEQEAAGHKILVEDKAQKLRQVMRK